MFGDGASLDKKLLRGEQVCKRYIHSWTLCRDSAWKAPHCHLVHALEKNPSWPLPTFWELLAIVGVPWLATASIQSLPPLSHGLPSVLVYFCGSCAFLVRILVMLDLGPGLIWHDLNLANCVLQDPTSKKFTFCSSEWTWIWGGHYSMQCKGEEKRKEI